MEGNQNIPSVIARLMGIDEQPPQKPSNRQLKVLSEEYLRRSASVGMLRENSLLLSRLSRKAADEQHAVKHVFGSKITEIEKQDSVRDLHLQRFDNPHQKGGIDYSESRELLQHISKVLNAEVAETGKLTMEPPMYSLMYPWKVESKSVKEDWKSMGSRYRHASYSGITADDPSFHAPKTSMTSFRGPFGWKFRHCISSLYPNVPLFSSKINKQIFERWKKTRSFAEVEESARGLSFGQTFAEQDKEARPTSLCFGFGEAVTDKLPQLSETYYEKDSLESRDSIVVCVCDKQHQCLNPDVEGSQNPDRELSNSKIISCVSDDNVCLEANKTRDDLEGDMDKEADGCSSSNVSENLSLQISSWDTPGEESSFRRAPKDSDSSMKLREMNQPSPDSVLEPPFKEENPHDTEIFKNSASDLSGLSQKLQLLNPESEETDSEGSGMAVSSDEDTEEGSDLSQESGKLWELSRPEESRDFSYLVDVLDEANLGDMDLITWLGTESPVSPLVFDALEKKYGKQTSWAKFERRLLFDLINSRLRDILDSRMDFCVSTKPLQRRLSNSLTRDDIEEELLMLLSQDKEASKDLGEKVLGGETKWMELGGDTSIICAELVDYLFDELAADFCGSESS